MRRGEKSSTACWSMRRRTPEYRASSNSPAPARRRTSTPRLPPVALTRSVAGLRSGLWKHRERWARLLPDRTLAVVCRGFLADCEKASGDWASVNPERADGDVLFVAAALCLYRMVVGPRAADRAVAFDALSAVIIGMICLLCLRWDSTLYFDAVWILTLVGFLGSSAIAKYLARGRIF